MMVLRVLAPAAGLLLAWVGAAQATTYSFTSIDVGSGGRSYADGINNLGQTVGFYAVASSPQYLGFLYSGGVFTTILVPGSSNTVAEGINNEGQIVGNYSDASGTHGFVDTGGVFTTINGPAGSDAAVTGINDVGQITGYYNNPNQTTSFLGTAGNLVTFGTAHTGASGINNAGQVVGSEGLNGFIYSNGVLSTIIVQDPHGNAATGLFGGINNTGQIGGYAIANSPPGYEASGFVDTGGSFAAVQFPGVYDTFVTGINDFGQLSGWYIGIQGEGTAFIATPISEAIPEPASLGLLAAALVGGLLRAAPHRRR